jgi:hypothetical protein
MKKKNKVEEEINKEIKELKKGSNQKSKKEKKKVTKAKGEILIEEKLLVNELKEDKEEKEYNSRKIRNTLEITIAVILSIFLILLLCNRSFFKEEYKTSKISLNIPLLMYYTKDDGNQLVFKTLRKSQYIKDFFDGELEKLTRYSCGNHSFYYNDETNTAIYSIDVKKDFAIKTVTINYVQGDADCLCETELTGAEAGSLCNR